MTDNDRTLWLRAVNLATVTLAVIIVALVLAWAVHWVVAG